MNLPTKQKQNNRTDLSLPKKVGVDEGSIKSLELADANYYTGFPGGSEVEDLPAIQEMLVQSLGQENTLEKEMAIHSSTLAWEIPWTEEPCGLCSPWGHERVRYDLATRPQQ